MDHFAEQLLIILLAGLLGGVFCRRLGVPSLLGYLSLGALLGPNAVGFIDAENADIQHLSEVGVFFLLFSIGLELSVEELRRLGRQLFLAGSAQMLFTAIPLAGLLIASGRSWQAAALAAMALAFSSTVLVFRALGELGQANTGVGRRAIGVLLFQDIALVPLLLCIPMIAGGSDGSGSAGVVTWAVLLIKAVLIVLGVTFLRRMLPLFVIPPIAEKRSTDLVILLTLATLGFVTLLTAKLGLPAALGALGAGLAFGGNRWTAQIDALVLPLREAFSAVFFVSLGLLVDLSLIAKAPVTLVAGLAILLIWKAVAGTLAFRLAGLDWQRAVGAGVGLAHVGEFAFVILILAGSTGVLSDTDQQLLVSIAGASLMVSPLLMNWGLSCPTIEASGTEPDQEQDSSWQGLAGLKHAIVIGLGPVGRTVVNRLEILGYDVCVIDQSPINLQPYAQQGFRVVVGSAQQPEILRAAQVRDTSLVVVCVPHDEAALAIARVVRELAPATTILVRCRYQHTEQILKQAGVRHVVSEESQAAAAFLRLLDTLPSSHRQS